MGVVADEDVSADAVPDAVQEKFLCSLLANVFVCGQGLQVVNMPQRGPYRDERARGQES